MEIHELVSDRHRRRPPRALLAAVVLAVVGASPLLAGPGNNRAAASGDQAHVARRPARAPAPAPAPVPAPPPVPAVEVVVPVTAAAAPPAVVPLVITPVSAPAPAALPVATAAPITPARLMAAARPRRVAPAPPKVPPLQRLTELADSSGWDWRKAGVTLHAGFHPTQCCHWGVYDYRDHSLWIGASAFTNEVRLRYALLHELAHGWQFLGGHRADIEGAFGRWGFTGRAALEASADCVAKLWGAKSHRYWDCAPEALVTSARWLAGDWS